MINNINNDNRGLSPSPSTLFLYSIIIWHKHICRLFAPMSTWFNLSEFYFCEFLGGWVLSSAGSDDIHYADLMF